jgi:hypothetical protein
MSRDVFVLVTGGIMRCIFKSPFIFFQFSKEFELTGRIYSSKVDLSLHSEVSGTYLDWPALLLIATT